MLSRIARLVIVIPALASSCIAMASTPPVLADIEPVVDALCSKQVVMLGEDSGHGAGATVAMKGRIMEALVERCEFDAVYFESPVYEFFDLEERLAVRDAAPEHLADAVGALWAETREFEPILHWLWDRASSGQVAVRGLDVQMGGVSQHYSARALPARLAAHAGEASTVCEEQLGRLTRWKFDASNPYDDAFRTTLRRCLTDIEQALVAADADAERVSHRMTVSLRHFLDMADGPAFNLRDGAMAQNFRWHRARAPDERAIIWTSTRHAVKAPLPEHPDRISLGMHLQRDMGDQLASIGFSARTGQHGRPSRTPASIVIGSGALEHGDDGMRYLGPAHLRQQGQIVSSVVAYGRPQRADWSALLDGIVLLSAETPLHALGPDVPSPSQL